MSKLKKVFKSYNGKCLLKKRQNKKGVEKVAMFKKISSKNVKLYQSCSKLQCQKTFSKVSKIYKNVKYRKKSF